MSYKRWLSKKIVGSLDFNEVAIKPFASYGVAGYTIDSPGICVSNDDQSCECWAPYLDPIEALKTIGNLNSPADIACHFANWLNISSPARPIKSEYISSIIALPPEIA